MKRYERQYEDLQSYVYRKAGWRKHLVGKKMVRTIAASALYNWPIVALKDRSLNSEVSDKLQKEVFYQLAIAQYRQHSKPFGSVWIIILSAVIGQVVRALIEWYWNNGRAGFLFANLRNSDLVHGEMGYE